MSLKDLNMKPVANQGATLVLQHPADRTDLKQADGSNITISLLGKDSDVYVKADNFVQNKRVEAAKRQVKFSNAEAQQQNAETIARCTTSWSGVPKCWVEGGEDEAPVEFSFENAVKLYTTQRWVFEQADNFVGDRANFLKPASAT